MIHYHISASFTEQNVLEIRMCFNAPKNIFSLEFPRWRPGRYEIANFAKDILQVDFFENGSPIIPNKKSSHQWEIAANKGNQIEVLYLLQTHEVNAGSSFVDDFQIYLNPVNSLAYVPELRKEICLLHLETPEAYQVISSLKPDEKGRLKAKSYDQLADSPIVTSNRLQTREYEVSETKFIIAFIGEVHISLEDEKKLLKDFKNFTQNQFELFGSFPFEQFIFLVQVLDHNFYHGVEHLDSTVLALGPGFSVFTNNEKFLGNYNNLLGVAAHELFHAWNVKTIKDKQFVSYNFQKENYTPLTLLAEGATTYYGDLSLVRSGGISLDEFLKIFSQNLEKHEVFYESVTYSLFDSSLDVWLDGYSGIGKGLKRYSIYTQGAIFFFFLDIEIRKTTGYKTSLDDLMKKLYDDFGTNGITFKNFRRVVELFLGEKANPFLEAYLLKKPDFSSKFQVFFKEIGIDIQYETNPIFHERYLGLKVLESNNEVEVCHVSKDGVLAHQGIFPKSKIVAVNHISKPSLLMGWMNYFLEHEKHFSITFQNNHVQKVIKISPKCSENLLKKITLVKSKNPTETEKKHFEKFFRKSF